MPELFRSSFATDADGFTGGSWSSAQGSAKLEDAAGALAVGTGVTAYRDFTAQTTGKVRLDFWFKDAAATTTTAASSDVLVYLMANGVSPSSASSVCTLSITHNSTDGGTSTDTTLSYRGASAFVVAPANTGNFKFRRGHWYKLSVVADTSTKTFDLYVSDVLFLAGLAWPNASAANVGRVAIVGQASAPDCFFDEIAVTSDWALSDSVLVDHTFVGGTGEIEATTPSTSLRDAHGQPWLIPEDVATFGGYTLGANGAVPDAARLCLALQRCAADGVIECEFQTAPTGVMYFGVAFRFWDYFTSTGAGGGLFRVTSSGNNYNLNLPNRAGANTNVVSGAFTPVANTTYTLKLEMRGRVLVGSIKAAAMDSGSYTVLFTHTVINSTTGGRGMLSEELAGPFVATTIGATTNYVRRFRFTGAALSGELVRTVGRFKYEISQGSLRGLYALDAAAPTKNLFWSKGIQYAHRSSADLDGAFQQSTIYDATNVVAVRQTGHNVTEYEHLGTADAYVTLLRRGPWVSDGALPTSTGENFAPDLDLRPDVWSKSFYTTINTGSASSRSDATYHDWQNYNTGVTLPAGNQSLTAYGSGSEVAMSQVVLADTGAPTAAWDVTGKFEGNGDPISRAVSVQGVSFSAGSTLRVARGFLLQSAATIDGAGLTAWRDNLAAPGTLTVATGTLKTDAAGDTNADGFNERHGWYEVTGTAGGATFTLPVASGSRHMPAFRVTGPATVAGVTINGSAATAGTDYVLDTVAANTHVVQLLSTRTADTTVALVAETNALVTEGFRNYAGTLLTNTTIQNVLVHKISDRSLVLSLADQVTHATTGTLTLTDAALVGGTAYMVTAFNADGTVRGAQRVVAA